MASALHNWLQLLTAAPLPVWRESRRALLTLAERGDYSGAALTRVIAVDPLLSAQLLRRANAGRAQGAIGTVEQAAVMLGADALGRFAAELPELEERLPEPALAALEQLRRHAFHVGYLARELVRRNRDLHFDDAFYAGLLHNLGELVLRAHSSPVLPQIHRLAQRRGLSAGEAAERVLGFELPELSTALAEHWRMPELLRGALNLSQLRDSRSELVGLASGILRGDVDRLRSEPPDPLLVRAGAILRESPAAVAEIVFAAAVGAAEWLTPRLPTADPALVDLFPREPVDSHVGEPPTAAAAPRPEALAAFDALMTGAPPLGLSQVLKQFCGALREGLGLDRVLFAALTRDQGLLRGYVFRGVAPDSPLRRFEFGRDERNLFLQLMERPGGVWVTPEAPPEVLAVLTPALRRVVQAPEFLVQSVFLGGKPVGLCYADRDTSGAPLDADTHAAFRQQCLQLGRHLARLAGKRS